MSIRETKAIINLDALAHNYHYFKKSSGKEVFGVVKANAYGHGDVGVAQELLANGASILCVSSMDEAIHLQTAGINCDLLIFGPVPMLAIEALGNERMIFTAASKGWLEQAESLSRSIRIHIEFNTGMNRLGFKTPQDVEPLIKSSKHLIEGVYTHFSSSDENEAVTTEQLRLFKTFLSQIDYEFKWIHAANSHGSTLVSDDLLNAIRVGIGLYGYHGSVLDLKPVMSLVSKVVHKDNIESGETVGYNRTYTALQDEMFATVPIGYADGLSFDNRLLPIYIHEKAYPIIGKICMDQLMVGVDEKVQVGDEVEIIGPNRTALMIAQSTGTIVYHVLTAISDRVSKEFVKNGMVIAVEDRRNG